MFLQRHERQLVTITIGNSKATSWNSKFCKYPKTVGINISISCNSTVQHIYIVNILS